MHEATIPRTASGKVYLAVGHDTKKCLFSLRWAKQFIPPQMQLVLLHIYVPVIPRVLGASWPASTFEEDIVDGYRTYVRNKIKNSMEECLQICEVQAEILIIDKHDVVPALLKLIKRLKITTLVMGAKNGDDWKSKTAVALEKQADLSCNILYIHDGILVSSRDQRANICTSRKSDISSLGGWHFSVGSNNTASKSTSFFNSRSTADTFDTEQLEDTSLDINRKFNAIIGLESLGTFKELFSRKISAEHSRDLYQAFHSKYYEIFTRCELIGAFDSVLGVDLQNLGEEHWKPLRSWPAVLDFVISILNTMHMQLKQNHPACDGFTHESLFEATKNHLIRLFTVASVVCVQEVRKSPEKLFCILNMYTSLTYATPTLREVFHTEFISRNAEELLSKLKDSTRGMIKELKDLIHTYSSQIEVQDGGIMSLTEYLVKYIRLLVKHRSSLDTILGHGDMGMDDQLTTEGRNPTGRLVFGLIADLDSVLKKQSELLSSRELRFLFLMNNTHLILQEVKSDMRFMVGSKWIGRRQDRIKEYMKGYILASWGPVRLNLETAKCRSRSKSLTTNVLSFLYTSSTPLQNFVRSFSETCSIQMCWKVPCSGLRKELRVKILEFVAPTYDAHLESLNQSIRGTAADFKVELKRQINELFEG